MEETGYASPNGEAAALYAEDLSETEKQIMFPGDDVLSRCEVFVNLPQETLNLYDQLWIDLKS
jgi:spermidine/putrescine transport system substrate-binding protein